MPVRHLFLQVLSFDDLILTDNNKGRLLRQPAFFSYKRAKSFRATLCSIIGNPFEISEALSLAFVLYVFTW